MATRTHPAGAAEFVPATRSLATLADSARSCRGCELYAAATQTVFGRGPRRARLVLVGEQPGDVEDREGRAFVGPAGRVLADALEEAGIDPQTSYLTNAVKHFHFTERGKRRLHQTPRAAHISACRPWLAAELTLVKPELVVCLGATAVSSVLGPQVKVMRDRGRLFERDGPAGDGRFLVTVHPSSILRTPPDERDAARAAFVADLRVAAQAVGQGGG